MTANLSARPLPPSLASRLSPWSNPQPYLTLPIAVFCLLHIVPWAYTARPSTNAGTPATRRVTSHHKPRPAGPGSRLIAITRYTPRPPKTLAAISSQNASMLMGPEFGLSSVQDWSAGPDIRRQDHVFLGPDVVPDHVHPLHRIGNNPVKVLYKLLPVSPWLSNRDRENMPTSNSTLCSST